MLNSHENLEELQKLITSKSLDELAFITNNLNTIESIIKANGVSALIENNLSSLIHCKETKSTNCPIFDSILQLQNRLITFTSHSRISSSIIDTYAKQLLITLSDKKVNVIVLKGFALGYQVYDSPSLRPKTDIDILINKNDKAKVIEVFKSLGYTNPRGWEPQAIINQFSMSKTLSKGVSVLFDVHLKISNSKQIENILNYDELLISANSTQLTNINLINKPYALTHAIFHLLYHKASGDLIKLIWHYDLYLITKQLNETELAQLKELIENKGLGNLVQYTLKLTANYFPTNELQHLIEWCETPDIAKTYQAKFDYLLGRTSRIKGVWLTLCATEGLSNKVAIIQEMVFPPAEEIYIKYGKDSGWPLVMLYIRRIFTGSIKYIFKPKKQ